MNESIIELIALQEIDLEIDEINQQIAQENNTIDNKEAALVKREEELLSLKDKVVELEKNCTSLDFEMADERDHVKDRQSKMMLVQTGREQTAILKEIEDGKRNLKAKEENITALKKNIDELNTEISEEETRINNEKGLLEEEKSNTAEVIRKRTNKKKTRTTARNKQAKKIEKLEEVIFDSKKIDGAEILGKYDTIRQHHNGLAMANVLQSACQGCYMAIPPQQYNLLLKGDQLKICPSCQRLVYHQETHE